MYNGILFSVSLSTDLLSAGAISILSSQLNRLLDLHTGTAQVIPCRGWKKWKQKGKKRESERERERARDKLISDLKWQFALAFCQENGTLMKEYK